MTKNVTDFFITSAKIKSSETSLKLLIRPWCGSYWFVF